MATKKAVMSPTDVPVDGVLDQLPDARRREAQTLIDLMSQVTGDAPVVWARNIIGFGKYHYRYPSGHEGEAPLISFATTARQHAIYLIGDFEQRHHRQVAALGKYSAGKGCLYVKRLSDVHVEVLKDLIDRSVRVRRGVDRAL